jgi:DNA-binding LacI/PurR family transcriptional regulator
MATLADVARLAGVTKATVSYVINNKGTVSEKTRKKVEAAIQLLDYQPNLLARGLSDGRTRILALVINTITNPFYAEFAEEVQLAARQRGYYVLLYSAGQPDVPQQALVHLYSLIDGLLVTKSAVPGSEVQRAADRGIPVVLCLGWEGDEQGRLFPLVYYDHFQAGKLAGEHLLQLGHRQCAIILPAAHHSLRLDGFRAAFAAAGRDLAPAMIAHCATATIQSGYDAARRLLALPSRPTAIFATNDLLAIGAMDATVDQGLRVPEDLSVIGFDDIQLASQVRPSLTSVALPRKDLAIQAVELLLQYIDGKDPAPAPEHLLLTPHLVARQSTAPLSL